MPWTSWPAATRRGTSCFPIAPVAPATNTLIISTPSSRITCASQHAVERPDGPEEDEGGKDKQQPTKQQDAVLAVGEGLRAEEAAPRHEAGQGEIGQVCHHCLGLVTAEACDHRADHDQHQTGSS